MNIRLAQSKDGGKILGLLDELLEEAMGKHVDQDSKPRMALFAKTLSREDIKMFIAEENGEVVGFINFFILPVVRRGANFGHVEDLVISKSLRGKGVGTELMKEVINYCKANNINVIKLDSGIELTQAHKFYEKMGGKFTEKMFRFDL